ncbi:MAG TPA: aminodeoxychorismate/anthranilate synthase component II [Acidobacteriota bacterium]|nr:aminodeoxychorismate/anthranilate synthase component II [Acidobacteriota bacterium]
MNSKGLRDNAPGQGKGAPGLGDWERTAGGASRQGSLLVIDNYDSFTFNLVQYLGQLGARPQVYRNDALSLEEVEAMRPDRIVISPGPGRPQQAGISLQVVERFSGRIPILGVCLGHQVIGQAFGGRIVHAPELKHGKTSMVHHQGGGLFRGLDNPFEATRYHSLVVERDSLPSCLQVTAWTEDGTIMGLRHRDHDTEGVQFHPESIMTRAGMALLERFLCCGS